MIKTETHCGNWYKAIQVAYSFISIRLPCISPTNFSKSV